MSEKVSDREGKREKERERERERESEIGSFDDEEKNPEEPWGKKNHQKVFRQERNDQPLSVSKTLIDCQFSGGQQQQQ